MAVAVPRLFLVTDRQSTGGRDLVTVVRAALDAGLPAVQLREKDLSGRALFALAETLRAETTRRGARFFVNDRLDVAIAVGADGVHLGEASMPPGVVRPLLPAGALVGLSTHAPGEPASRDADFIFFGPLHATPSKTGLPQGLARLAEAVRAAPVPVIAIGGLSTDTIRDASAAGAAGIAVIRAILAAPDPAGATRALMTALR